MAAQARKSTRTTTQARARKGKASDAVPGERRTARVSQQDHVHQTPVETRQSVRVEDQFCVRCGRGRDRDGVEFRSPQALKCTQCDDETKEERKTYHRDYHKARGHAIRRLIDEHQERFEVLLVEERQKLEASR